MSRLLSMGAGGSLSLAMAHGRCAISTTVEQRKLLREARLRAAMSTTGQLASHGLLLFGYAGVRSVKVR
jgi:hypothetical protein